ncbi:MAG: hypothetical protein IKN48_03005 [Bacteroidaceae bacterium]|nr:hypothetical protein [Bacteroidaceae bacterium]
MKVLCISLCAVFLLSCQNASIEKQINSFPLVESLLAEEVLVPPELLAPSNFFISEDKLVIPQMKMDSVFYIYNLPGCEFAFKDGIKGPGPNDIGNLNFRTFSSYGADFRVLSSSDMKVHQYGIDGNHVVDRHNATPLPASLAVNSFSFVGDSLFVCMGDYEGGYELELHNMSGTKSMPFSQIPQWHGYDADPNELMFIYFKNTIGKPDGSMFAAFYAYWKRFRIYDDQGALIRDVRVEDRQIPSFKSDAMNREQYYVSYPKATDEYLFCLYTDPEDGQSELHVFDWEGNAVALLNLGRKVDFFDHYAKEGKLYAIDASLEDRIFVYSLPDF